MFTHAFESVNGHGYHYHMVKTAGFGKLANTQGIHYVAICLICEGGVSDILCCV